MDVACEHMIRVGTRVRVGVRVRVRVRVSTILGLELGLRVQGSGLRVKG